MGRCLGIACSTGSVVMRDSRIQGEMLESPKSLEEHNSLNTRLNLASEESIGIYAKSRCQWTSCLIKKSLDKGDMAVVNLHGP